MNDLQSITLIIETAVRREEEAFGFYQNVAARMSNPAVKEAFSQLAEDELGHRDFLKRCLADPSLLRKLPVPEDYQVAEATAAPMLTVDAKPVDALALAMKKEQEAAEFYTKLAQTAADPAYQETFRGLARMELAHKTRLESLFVNIGYPEVF